MPKCRVIWLLLFATAFANAGCLAATVGAVGAAGAGYAYYRGNVPRNFQSDYDPARAAVHAALADMSLPIVGEQRIGNTGSVDALTGTGDKVHVSIETKPTPIPADGPRTQIAVRVGTFGDQVLSDRILHHVSQRLNTATAQTSPPPVGTWGPPANQANAVTPAAHTPQTSEPPLSPNPAR